MNSASSTLFGQRQRKALFDPVIDTNPIAVQVLGICSALAVTTALDKALVMSLAVVVVAGLASLAVSLLRSGRMPEVGQVFSASHASMRDDFEISCAELDAAVEVAMAHGALGARMTGGGFGGSAIALVPADSTATVTGAVIQDFTDQGFGTPDCFAVTAGGPARREC